MNQIHIDAAALLAGKAITTTQGNDREILDITEDSDVGHVFPPGTRVFDVISESAKCTHTPRCQWYDSVYLWQGRVVVVPFRELMSTSLADVIRRLHAGGDALPS